MNPEKLQRAVRPATQLQRVVRPATQLRRLRRIGATVAVLAVASMLTWRGVRWQVGSPVTALDERWHVGRQVLDRQGDLLYFSPSYEGLRGTPESLEAIGDRVPIVTIVAEDHRFLDHDGVDRLALVRAIGQAVSSGGVVSGASTITQQLVEQLRTGGHPGPTSLRTKLAEFACAQNLEESLDKDQILEAYLNRIPYGNNLVGIRAAAETYFGRKPSALSWAQAAYLAVIPRAPSTLNPYSNDEGIRVRQRQLLAALHKAGHLDRDALETALVEPIEVRPRESARRFRAPHFSLWVLESANEAVVDTTLDPEIQKVLEDALSSHRSRLARSGAHQSAGIVVENANGHILAYVGNPDWNDGDAGRLDMVQARRPAGSILKPFGYALAYELGMRPTTILADVPAHFADAEGGDYSPENIDHAYLGPIAAAEALALSRNIPAVEVGEFVGGERLRETLRTVGFKALTESTDHYGPALILGTPEVSLIEVASAYTCLANAGECVDLTWDPYATATRRRVFSAASAELVAENSSNPEWRMRFLSTGVEPTRFDVPVATKTGTSQDHRDTWAVAFTSEITVAIWAGNADGTTTRGLTGATGAGPIALNVMRPLIEGRSDPGWHASTLVTAVVCPISGEVRGPACPEGAVRQLDPRTVPTRECSVHHLGKSHGGQFECGAGEEFGVVLDGRFRTWLDEARAAGGGMDVYGHAYYLVDEATGCE